MVQERVGGLLLSRAPGSGDRELEIRRGEFTALASSPGLVMVLVLVLGSGLLFFAVFVRSIPAMASVGTALSALAWLVVRQRTLVIAPGCVVAGPLSLRVETAGESLTAPLADIEAVGIGEGGPGRSTLFLQARERGRILIFDWLEADEAKAAKAALDEVLSRHRD